MVTGYKDITGHRFGRLTALSVEKRQNRHTYWRCKCDCGNETVVMLYKLRMGATKSCGCLRREMGIVDPQTFKKVLIPERTQKWIIKHYAHTKNSEIKERFKISDGTLHRFARKHGLKKSKQYMNKMHDDLVKRARRINTINNWPPKGYAIPRSEDFYFKKGVSNLQRLGAKREKQRIEKARASLAQTRKLEKARVLFGLPQETKLKVKQTPRRVLCQRYYLRKLGYIVEGTNAYYNAGTKRSEIYESGKTKSPFRFYPIEAMQ